MDFSGDSLKILCTCVYARVYVCVRHLLFSFSCRRDKCIIR